MTTYSTTISDFKVCSKDGMEKVLKSVRFEIQATNGENTQSSFFPVILDDPDANSFVAFENLTKEQVMQWVIDKIGQEEIDALKNGLDAALAAPSTTNSQSVLLQVSAPWENK